MSSFHHPGLLSQDSDSNLQSADHNERPTPSLNLPPLRSIDPLQQFATPPSKGPGQTSHLPVTELPPIAQYYPQLPRISQYHCSNPASRLGTYLDSGNSRVQANLLPQPTLPISPTESHRLISGGRHKKEVKRRTKTGCLTCRKRRIKVSHLSLGLKHVIELPM
jgi:white-opaque regulator 2